MQKFDNKLNQLIQEKKEKYENKDNQNLITFSDALNSIVLKVLENTDYDSEVNVEFDYFNCVPNDVFIQNNAKDYFLDGEYFKFPVYNFEKECIDCKYLFLSFMRSSFEMNKMINENEDDNLIEYFKGIKEKSREMFFKNKCENEMSIQFDSEDDNNKIDLISFSELFYFDINELDNEIFESIKY